jgi:hypothetical protein
MLQITVPALIREDFDEGKEEFVYTVLEKEQTLCLEHSLVSLSKWESKWHKPFLSKGEKTGEEFLDYIRCMTLDSNVDPDLYYRLSADNYDQIEKYIGDSMTATTFSDDSNRKQNRDIITAEIIYYWMISLNIPIEQCERWHLSRLITLIRVCNIKNAPPKKRNKGDTALKYARMNAARKKKK